MRQFPVGEQTFRGVPFSIVDPAKNGGRSCIALRGQAWKGYPPRDYFPESASIAVGKKATTLYFLQTCAWPATAGQSAARYVLRYEDGSTAETPLVCGYDLCDWFNIKDADRCFVAWASLSRGGAPYGVHVAWWRNPFPDKKIESLTFRSENTSAVPVLLAVTLSDQEPCVFGEPVDASLDKTDVSTWFPFTFPWCEAEPGTATDVSFLLDPPAGKHGFVMARDGHFFFQNGKRAKFWGVNLDRVPCFPHRENADRIAAHLAKYGNNIVRLHCLESFQPTKENIFDQSHDDSLHLSPENMERLDYFLAQLKKRGIYVVIDLWGFRKFLPGDGVKDREAWQGRQVTSMQGAVIFNERLQELEREYARLLLTHVNPHTGLALKDDPQLALIELFNEVSLLVRWTWSAMPPSYVQELTEMWNTWLVGMYRSRDGLAQAWTNADGKCFLQAEEDPSKGTVRPFFDLYALGAPKDAPEDRLGDARVNDAIRFLYELEVKHSRMMRDHLRSLGVKVPIASTGALGETAPSAAAAATLDFIDQHTYWHHPSYPDGRTRLYGAGETEVSPFVTPVNDARSECHMNNVMRTAAVKAAGLPLVNSEWNIPWPNEHRMAGPLFIAAYACLQDWDGILLYAPRPIKTLAESPEAERCDTAIAVFDPMFDPSRMATWQAAGTMFLRGDVQAANKLVTIVHGENDPFFARTAAIEPHRQPHGARYAPFRFLPFVSRVESCWSGLATPRRSDLSLQARLDAPRDPNADPQWLLRVVQESARAQRVWPEHVMRQDVLSSDTGQLAWAYGDGYFTADAPLSQAAVGRIGGQDIRLSALSVGATTERCAVSATSLDGKPLSASARILLCAGARAQNTDLRLQRLGQWLTVLRGGKAPVLAEPVKAQVSLQRDGAAPKLRAWALAPSGQRVQELGIQSGPQAASLEIGTRAVSIYYELAAK
ncbi:MAG: hypothetical protein FJ278_04405 [Planctomycetes bacterium]|nr:hypothetical protein [Planctomycetota bacterium]